MLRERGFERFLYRVCAYDLDIVLLRVYAFERGIRHYALREAQTFCFGYALRRTLYTAKLARKT